MGSFSRDTDLKIPRQLASSRRFSVKANPGQGPAYSWLRHCDKFGKVEPQAQSKNSLPGHVHRHDSSESILSSPTTRKVQELCSVLSVQTEATHLSVADHSRLPVIHEKASSSRSIAHLITPVEIKGVLVPFKGSSLVPSSSLRSSEEGLSLVAGQQNPNHRSASSFSSSRDSSILGRLVRGLGSSLIRSSIIRGVQSPRKAGSY